MTTNEQEQAQAALRIIGETSVLFEMQRAVRQGCIHSPYHFIIYSENIMRCVKNDEHYDTLNSFNMAENPIS